MSEELQHTLILGVGGAGARVAARIAAQKIAGLDTAAIDTDRKQLESLPPEVSVISAGSEWSWLDGSGCGGDLIRGEQAISPKRSEIRNLVINRPLVIVVGGLGGGVSTSGARIIASVLRTEKVPSVFMMTTPFSFESFAKRKAADDCLNELLPLTDILLRIPNDLLFSRISSDSPVQEAFERSCDELARSVIGICGILNCTFAVNTDYAGFMALLHGKRCQCSLGVGLAVPTEAEPDRVSAALRKALESPFLGSTDKIRNADAVVVSVCAGPQLQLGEMKRPLEDLSAMLKPGSDMISGFNTAGFMGSAFQITIITIRYEEEKHTPGEEPKPETGVQSKRTKPKKKENSGLEQGVLGLQTISKGVFANTTPVMYKNEDLDEPTFQRRNIQIDQGVSSR